MANRRSTIFSLILLLAVALAMFGDLLFAGPTRVLGHPGSDMFLQYFAWREFGFRELANGNFALWNPHIFSGAPYFGGMQGALLYPPNWLFLVLSTPVAINWTVALHVFAFGALVSGTALATACFLPPVDLSRGVPTGAGEAMLAAEMCNLESEGEPEAIKGA